MEKVPAPDGTPLALWSRGRGRPLLLVHGTGNDHTRWDPMVERLAPHATTVAMDRRGRGESGDTPPYALEREFGDVAAVIDALAARHGGPVDCFGHSYGALCALGAATRTRNLRRLVLYEPGIPGKPGPNAFADAADHLLARGDREAVVEAWFRMVLNVPEAEMPQWRSQPAWKVRVGAAGTIPREERAESAFRFDPAQLRTWRGPTLLLLGGETRGYLREATGMVADALRQAVVSELRGQGHFAFATAPEAVAGRVVPFLADDPAR